ncbi:MAG TPA: hypothetical protein VHP38_17620 [Ruminiclostridium sp.]|nr:hypothetical protein [Ruminiclostridium sp.]
MKNRLIDLINVKSIVTLSLIFTLECIVISGKKINSDVFLLFSNCTTMIVTYFFTKKPSEQK